MLNRVAFTFLIGLVLCGCSDRPQATTDEVAQPESTPEPKTVRRRRSAPTKIAAHKFDGPRDALVKGRLTVDVMEIVAPPRANELTQRFLQAARENPDWFLEYVKKAPPGEPLPYDPRLGLSEAEYTEFLALSKKMTTQKMTEATLDIATQDNDVYVLDGGQALADLTGIEIDLKNDCVRTLFGILTERSEINAPANTALGAWVGIGWKLEKLDPNGIAGTVAKFAVGRLNQSGRCVIYYDVKQIGLDEKTRISHILNYDVPPRE